MGGADAADDAARRLTEPAASPESLDALLEARGATVDDNHGWKNIGTDEAIVINMPTSTYRYDEPDAWDLPWDSQAAQELIPYQF